MSEESPSAPLLQPSNSAALKELTEAPRAHASERDGAAPLPEWRDEGIDWLRYWSVIVRYRWWVLVGTSLGLAAGVGSTRFLKAPYVTRATVWIDAENRQDANRGPIRSGQLFESYSWVDLLRSYAVLDEVVRQLRLYVIPGNPRDTVALSSFDIAERFRPGGYRVVVDDSGRGFALTGAGGTLIERGPVGGAIGTPLGFRWKPPTSALPPGASVSFTLVTPRDAAQQLFGALQVHLDENGNFLRLELDGTDPNGIAAVLNAITQRYVAVAADLKRAKVTELTRVLNAQLATAAGHLHDTEAGLERFRVNTVTLPSDQSTPVAPGLEATRDPVFRHFFDMRIEREELRRDREAIARVLGQVGDSGLSVEGLTVVGSVQRSAELTEALKELTAKQAEQRALRYRYTNRNPLVNRVTDAIETLEHRTIPALTEALLGQIVTREQVLDSLVQSAGRELREIPQRAVEEARLRREVSIAENLYTTLQQRYEEARLAEASTMPDVRVLDAAVAPQEPIKNRAPALILSGLLGGLGLSLMGVVLADRLDHRVRYPQQVTREMGLTILGAVPRFKVPRDGITPQDTTQVVEALRTVRLNVTHAYGAAGPTVVTITSPGPGDGKSFLTANLGRAFANAGQRTLVIDGDLRRGVLHRFFRGARRPGLTDFLAGLVPFDAIVQQTDHPAVSFIASGTRKTDAPELLGSPAMAHLLTSTRNAFQALLLDSPPLGAGVDPFILGMLTGSLLVVLRTGMTDRDLAHSKLDMLDRLPIRLLGAVLNDVDPHGIYRYYAYLSGYAAEDEPEVLSRWALSQGVAPGPERGDGH